MLKIVGFLALLAVIAVVFRKLWVKFKDDDEDTLKQKVAQRKQKTEKQKELAAAIEKLGKVKLNAAEKAKLESFIKSTKKEEGTK